VQGARILVVDDQEANRQVVRDVLEPLGYQVSEASDGEDALDAIAREVPDLILCDVVMPRRDGYSVCQALKSDPKTRLVPIVMLTSLDQLPDKVRAVELGADDYLTKPFNILELTTRVRSLLSLKHFTDEFEHASRVLESIALVVESRDRYTGDHCRRLGRYGTQVGQAMGVPDADLRSLYLAGIFHDLGKIAVSDVVLNKPGRLTQDELTLMRSHPVVGADLCRTMRTMEKIVPLIRHHHERLDGSGYPDGLKGKDIPLVVRILSVVDVYDALATERPYRGALTHAKCMEIMRDEVRRGWWDPDVLETLDRCLRST
jgi:cyclic di-GMP phosphodiesterase